MKRFGVFACIALFAIGFFNIFSTEKAFAAITQAEFNTIKDEAFRVNVTPFFEYPGTTNGQMLPIYEDKVVPTLNASAVEVFYQIKDRPETTPATARRSLYTRWESDLFGISSSLDFLDRSSGAAESIERARASVNAAAAQAHTTVRTESGAITQDQANAERERIAAGQSAQIASTLPSNQPKECGVFGEKSSILKCIDEGVTFLIKNVFLQIGGFLVWLAANMLNYAIQISILGFAQWAPDSLYPIWLVIRQIVSLAVVFAGLWLGFMYIIGREDTFGKYVGWLIIFALFVNFSYPVTRALVDVSNIISLNVYAASVGTEPLRTDFASAATTLGENTAGAQIMKRLGLQGLIGSATGVAGSQSGIVDKIQTTPAALVAVVFVFYAAYIFLMATGIIAIRTAVLVFLIVASPLLLVDSVIPKLGDAAMKLRKYFFQQLAVAPVFMIMLALTLKFMEIFQTSNGPLAGTAGGVTGQTLADGMNIQVFFSIFMMLIMLHIMIKVTKEVGGAAGEFATNVMGKVGGFGLGLASGGAGLLARGTIGAGAARLRDSGWMDKLQGSRMGRGLYGISNSLAQSTFDTRNIGMVSAGMQKAGLTSIGGVGMQGGLKMGADQRFAQKQEEMEKKAASIKDDTARAAYRKQSTSVLNRGLVSAVDPRILKAKAEEAEKEIQNKRAAQMAAFAGADEEKRNSMLNQAKISGDHTLQNQLKVGEEYLAIDNTAPDAAVKKAEALKKLGNDKIALELLKSDPFAELNEKHTEKIKKMEESLARMKRGTPQEKKLYDDARVQIEEEKKAHNDFVKKVKEDTKYEYTGGGPRLQPRQTDSGGSDSAGQGVPNAGGPAPRSPGETASVPPVVLNADGTADFNNTTYPDYASAVSAKRQYRQAPYTNPQNQTGQQGGPGPAPNPPAEPTLETDAQADARVRNAETV